MSKAPLSLDTTCPVDFEPGFDLDWDASSLDQIMRHYGSDKSSLDHGYCEIYEAYFRSMRPSSVFLVEIGVACGASLKGWARYFRHGHVLGVDIRPECKALCRDYPNVHIAIRDATKVCNSGPVDIIIDDGSHVAQDIVDAFHLHWPHLSPGGIYAIEDTRCVGSGYRTHLQPDQDRYDPAPYYAMLRHLMTDCDNGGEVEMVNHYRELTIIRKRA